VSIGNTTTSTSATAQPFSTSSIGLAQSFYYASDFTLTGLDLNLYNLGASNTGTYTISLYCGSLPSSGIQLNTGTWASLHSTNSSNVVSVTGLSNNLIKDTTYWIGVTSSPNTGTQKNWAYNDSNLFGNNTTATDTAFYNGTTWTSQGTSKAFGLRIVGNTAAVPEPSTLILFSSAAGGLVIAAIRKRLAAKPAAD